MGNKNKLKQACYDRLLRVSEERKPAESLSSSIGELSIEEAYEVQAMLVDDRIRRGERVIGWKVGATSQAVMDQLKIDEPIFGCMTSQSYYSSSRGVKASHFIKPAIEPEIAFIMGKTLRGPGLTQADVIPATSGIMAAVELVDCRIKDWKATTAELVADNACHAGIILGPFTKPISGFDLTREGMVLTKNGQLLASACGVEALGNPLNVVTWLANKLFELDKEIRPGEIVSTGSLTKYYFVEPGDVLDVSFSSLGSIHFTVKN